jgi:hypothetical protein
MLWLAAYFTKQLTNCHSKKKEGMKRAQSVISGGFSESDLTQRQGNSPSWDSPHGIHPLWISHPVISARENVNISTCKMKVTVLVGCRFRFRYRIIRDRKM